MKARNIITVVVLFAVLLNGCGGKEAAPATAVKKPTLDVAVDVNGNEAKVKITTDLHITEVHGVQRIEGEGHIHMFVDNGEKVVVTTDQTMIKDLAKGMHTLKVSLHNNDHTPYDVSKSLEFEVK